MTIDNARGLFPRLTSAGCASLIVTLLGACGDINGRRALPGTSRSSEYCDTDCDDAFSIRVPNSLRTEHFFNALIANPISLAALNASPLNDATFTTGGHPDLQLPLHDPFAQRFMHYLVGCALTPGDVVSWVDPYDSVGYQWVGDSGHCADWKIGPPSPDCLNRVSGCIFARNNKLGIPVMLSMRGANQGPFPSDRPPPVTVTENIDRAMHIAVPSFMDCPGPNPILGNRNCGWIPNFAGRCTPGSPVSLGAGGVPNDPGCGGCAGCPRMGTLLGSRMIMRVCDGLDGCDAGSPRQLTDDEGLCDGAPSFAPAVAFTCPASGFFSVMLAPYSSAESADGIVESSTTAIFPVPQTLAYTIREAAFYGNLFSPAALDQSVNVRIEEATGSVLGREEALRVPTAFHSAWTCYDSGWTTAQAYAYHRVCATPDDATPTMSRGCTAHVVGGCRFYPPPDPSFMCEFDRRGVMFPNYDDYGKCHGSDGSTWYQPMTVFLYGACDIPGQQGFCERRQ